VLLSRLCLRTFWERGHPGRKFVRGGLIALGPARHLPFTFLAFVSFVVLFSACFPAHGEVGRLVYRQIVCQEFRHGDSAIPEEALTAQSRPAAREVRDREGVLWRLNSRGLVEIRRSGKKKIWTPKDGLPFLPLTSIAVGPEGWVWLGTPDGAICFRPAAHLGERWFYFWGRRYLADNLVLRVVAGPHRAWIETRTGISLIEFKNFFLEEKSALFISRLHRCNDRYGLIGDARLLNPGDLASCQPVSNDNDGLWTSLYIASECFRYAASHSPEALHNAETSLKGLFRLLWITGIIGFPARSFIHRGEGGDTDGEWRWTPDGMWKWKGNTSSDELVGHFFVYGIAYDLLPQADEFDREAIRNATVTIANHLLEHGWNLTEYNGRVTEWGRYSPDYFKTPEGRQEAPLSSLELLSLLRVAYHVSGDSSFLAAYHRLIDQDGYLTYIAQGASNLAPPARYNYSDEELAFLSFYPLLQYEDDPRLRRQLQLALRKLWRHAEAEHNPLWDYIYEVGTGAADYDLSGALNTLERIPLDTTYWTVHNSQRLDLPLSPWPARDGHRQSLEVIPPDERCTSKWNGNPFELNCNDGGRREDDGAFFLLPYWLGRYYKLLPP
jgi:hypothetical protein